MDKVPLYWENQVVGELMAEGEALYTWFSARSRLMGQGLWCAWAVGDRGEFRLGVLEPAGSQLTIRRRFSSRMTAPFSAASLLCVCQRPCAARCGILLSSAAA